MPRFLLLAVALLAGCSSKPPATPAAAPVTPPPPPPFVEIDLVSAKFLAKLAEAQDFGRDWSVRLEVVWEAEPLVKVHLEKKPPGKDDFAVEVQGLRIVMANEQKVYLKGAVIRYFEVREGAGFDVTFPNRTDEDRKLAGEWLKKENAKHIKK